MSARSPIESPSDVAAREVLQMVGAARRRLRTVATIRLVAIAAPAGVAVGAALVLAGWAPAETPRALGVLGAVAAAVWAAVRTPPPATVARLLDARLGLRDRVAAAVQLQQTDGPIAALVARDAAARLATVRMTAVFPLAIGRSAIVAITLAIGSVAWLASGHGAAPSASPMPRAGSDPAGADASARQRSDSHSAATNAEPRTSSQPAAARDAAARAQDERGSAAREAFAPAAGARALQDPPPPVSPSGGSSANPRTTTRQAGAAPAAASAAGRAGRGGAAGTTANGALTAGAGGAAPGSALASVAGGEPMPAAVAVSYRTARAGAEAALARDVIPPDYRDHVRAYFRTLPSSAAGGGGTR